MNPVARILTLIDRSIGRHDPEPGTPDEQHCCTDPECGCTDITVDPDAPWTTLGITQQEWDNLPEYARNGYLENIASEHALGEAPPLPIDPDTGKPITMQDLREELPDGARVTHIEISAQRLGVEPMKTIAAVARIAYQYGQQDPDGHVHHELCAPLTDQVLRIALLVADEPKPEPDTGEQEAAAERETAHTMLGYRPKR